MKVKRRSYWVYSLGNLVAWSIVLTLVLVLRGRDVAGQVLLVVGGFAMCWVSQTIARYIYPPPARWTKAGPSSD